MVIRAKPLPGRVVHVRDREADVYIGRPSEWGNPYIIGVHGSRLEVCDLYEQYLRKRIAEEPAFRAKTKALYGLNLACFCKGQRGRNANLACHGDRLLLVVNELNEE